MSFNLYFFKEKTATISLNEVVSFFNKQPNCSIKPLNSSHYAFEFLDLKTNLKFTFSYDEKEELITDLQFDENYVYCYMSFTMSYLRPSFWSYESMPIVEAFSTTFSLKIHDPQTSLAENNALKYYTKDVLIESYIQSNRKAIEEFEVQVPLNKIPKVKADAFYHYFKSLPELKKAVNVGYLTDIVFLKHRETNEVFTVCSWEDGLPILLPQTDFVLTLKNQKSFLFKKQIMSLVPYETIDSQMANLFIPTYGCNLTDETRQDEIKSAFNNLPQNSFDLYEMIESDELVDYDA